MVDVEIVVVGGLGDLALSAFEDLDAESRQVVVSDGSDMLATFECLLRLGVDVYAVRERLATDPAS